MTRRTQRQPADVIRHLERLLDREDQRLDSRRVELTEVREAIRELIREMPSSPVSRQVDVEPVPAELAPDVIGGLYDEIGPGGIVRNVTRTFDIGPGLEDERVRDLQARMADGLVARAIYPLSVLDTASGRRWLGMWAEAGEEQRFVADPPSEFLIAGTSAVIACAVWNAPESDYVVIRDPMLVSAFIALYDTTYATAVELSSSEEGGVDDERLIDLMALGLKDEAIARTLGSSLRTVRRRIAALMDGHGVDTRFQLGAALQARGRLEAGPLPMLPAFAHRGAAARTRAGSGSRPGR